MLEMVRWPGVFVAFTLDSQAAKAAPLEKEVSIRVSRGELPITPLLEFQVATSPKTDA